MCTGVLRGVKIGFANENGSVQKQVDCGMPLFFPTPVGWVLELDESCQAGIIFPRCSVLTPNQVVSAAKPP